MHGLETNSDIMKTVNYNTKLNLYGFKAGKVTSVFKTRSHRKVFITSTMFVLASHRSLQVLVEQHQ